MTLKITQIDKATDRKTILRVEGTLSGDNAGILERAFNEIDTEGTSGVEMDLAGISFLDSDGAFVLRQIEDQGGHLTGLDFFLQKVIEASRSHK